MLLPGLFEGTPYRLLRRTKEKTIMKYKCLTGKSEKIKEGFLELPEKLYKGDICPQDKSTEKALLLGTHPLSSDFSVVPLLVVDEKEEAAGRALLTFYEGEDTAYLGFFECINDTEPCRVLMEKAEETAEKNGKKRIIGPVDSSIWIGYRFRIFHKEHNEIRPYTSEPWNKPYYADFWEQWGFNIYKRYFSFRLKKITEKEGKPKYVERVEEFKKKGYKVLNLEKKYFDRTIKEIYELLIELYASFPGYKRITYDEFYALFCSLKYILSKRDVILVYKEEKLVAFSISVPNFYENLFGKMTVTKLLKVLLIKIAPKEMVYLYLGVDPSHLGLGSVMAELIRRELYKNRRVPIKALILENKATGAYYNELLDEKIEYVLLKKEIKDSGAEYGIF